MGKNPYFARFINKPDNPFSWLLLDKVHKEEKKEKKKLEKAKGKVAFDSMKKDIVKRKTDNKSKPIKAI